MPLCISVEKTHADLALRELRKRGLLDSRYSVTRANGHVVIPVLASSTGDLELPFAKFKVYECYPPARRKVEVDVPSLDLVGNVVILRENVLKYRRLEDVVSSIKQVYPRVKAIWVKEETVEEFRTPSLKLLWGEEIRDVSVKEYGIVMRVKLGEVYFNPRLAEEHRRVAQLVRDSEVVVDAFSGIGGFSLHIASLRRALILANDLNPRAYELLLENIELNLRRLKGAIIPLNNNVAELPDVLRGHCADRVIADLPVKSLEYVEVYEEMLKPGGILHLYTLFAQDVKQLRERLSEAFVGWFIQKCVTVLEYAPRMSIYRCDLVKSQGVKMH